MTETSVFSQVDRVAMLARTALASIVEALVPITDYVQASASPFVHDARHSINASLAGKEHSEVVLLTAAATLCALVVLWAIYCRTIAPIKEKGILPLTFGILRGAFGKGAMLNAKTAIRDTVLASRKQSSHDRLIHLPARGAAVLEVMAKLRQRAQDDVQVEGGQSKLSGAIYMGSQQHKELLDAAYSMFSLTNPLHGDAFPSVRQMEAEVVAMTAGMLGGGPDGANPDVCGAMTSGGSESILIAIKASRDYMRATRGIRAPEMICGASAHAAYWKAAEYFKIKLHVVPVGSDYRLSAAAVRRCLNSNTIVVVASAPGFPHGVVDHVEEIARLAARRRVCLHVDACLGGFCLPFVRKLGYPVPPFDFAVPGVTSMSVDTHKFGLAHKGTSVVLYSSPEIRQYQYTSITDWSGGLYISPGMAGSRPGALIATAWASLVHLGEEGLLEASRKIMAARDAFIEGLRHIPELQLIGEPEMAVVAFQMAPGVNLDIYVLNDLMGTRGWHLNALQRPAALHFCFTAMNCGSAVGLVEGLRCCLDEMAAGQTRVQGGTAPLYGMGNVSIDRGMLGEFLVAFQDAQLLP